MAIFLRGRIEIEGGDFSGDQLESGLWILWYVDAQIQGCAQEVSVDLFFGGVMAETQDHHLVAVAIEAGLE